MFVKYWVIPFLGGYRDYYTCVEKVERLTAKMDPNDDYQSWGIYIQGKDFPIARFETGEYAMKTLDRFCNAIASGERLFDLEACEEEFGCVEPDNPESEDKTC